MAKLLPTKTSVKNWPVYAGTREYSPSADKLYKIYNGGDQVYIDAGCVEAITQSYRNSKTKRIATVNIHRMKNAAKAKAFYLSHRSTVKAKKGYKQLKKLKTAGHLYSAPGSNSTYGHHKQYYVTVDVAGTTTGDKTAASLLLRAVLAKVAKVK